ncbi:MAG: D-alanine--D-alanine ligase [Clostridia bacterium]|nr:D-alanine--D-alanine ligase [Clostridia bacterium]
MKNLGVIFGGVTCEHDVSIVTGLQLIENVDKKKYVVIPIYIHSDGNWYTGDKLLNANIYKNFESHLSEVKEAIIPPNKAGLVVYEKGLFAKEKFISLDAVIPTMHGMNGEDGTLQGLLELANIPYSSSGVLGASVGMDKILMKKVFESYNLPILPYVYFIRDEWMKNSEEVIKKIESTLSYPMFVKPSNLGSSIGITKAKNKDGLIQAIEVAISYDSRIVVEKSVENIKEINCSALGYKDDVETSCCEEPISWKDFLTFEDKYLRGGKSSKGGAKTAPTKIANMPLGSKQSGSMESMDRRIPADIPDEQTNEIKDLTIKTFKALNSKGVVRIDYIIDKDENKVYLNEINTIPGSMAFYLWKHDGMEYSELIDRLVEIAELAHDDKVKNNYTFDSNIIGNITKIEK